MVEIRRKVRIREKISDSNTNQTESSNNDRKSRFKFFVLICILVLALLIVVFLFKQCGSSDKDISDSNSKTESTETNQQTPVESVGVVTNNTENTYTAENTSEVLESGDKDTIPDGSTNLDSSTPIESFSNSSDQYIETMALKVIRGLYGNGQVRKDKLKEEYGKIQKRVNEILIK